jgi:hypothetical protein
MTNVYFEMREACESAGGRPLVGRHCEREAATPAKQVHRRRRNWHENQDLHPKQSMLVGEVGILVSIKATPSMYKSASQP